MSFQLGCKNVLCYANSGKLYVHSVDLGTYIWISERFQDFSNGIINLRDVKVSSEYVQGYVCYKATKCGLIFEGDYCELSGSQSTGVPLSIDECKFLQQCISEQEESKKKESVSVGMTNGVTSEINPSTYKLTKNQKKRQKEKAKKEAADKIGSASSDPKKQNKWNIAKAGAKPVEGINTSLSSTVENIFKPAQNSDGTIIRYEPRGGTRMYSPLDFPEDFKKLEEMNKEYAQPEIRDVANPEANGIKLALSQVEDHLIAESEKAKQQLEVLAQERLALELEESRLKLEEKKLELERRKAGLSLSLESPKNLSSQPLTKPIESIVSNAQKSNPTATIPVKPKLSEAASLKPKPNGSDSTASLNTQSNTSPIPIENWSSKPLPAVPKSPSKNSHPQTNEMNTIAINQNTNQAGINENTNQFGLFDEDDGDSKSEVGAWGSQTASGVDAIACIMGEYKTQLGPSAASLLNQTLQAAVVGNPHVSMDQLNTIARNFKAKNNQ
jgi:hypothetical protein